MGMTPGLPVPLAGSSPDPGHADIHALMQRLNTPAPYRIHGRVRRCQGALAVCQGLNDLIGLGDACWIERGQYNPHECDAQHQPSPLLAEVVAIEEAGAHLLPFERLDGIGVGARVTVAPDHDRVRPSEAWLGRVAPSDTERSPGPMKTRSTPSVEAMASMFPSASAVSACTATKVRRLARPT